MGPAPNEQVARVVAALAAEWVADVVQQRDSGIPRSNVTVSEFINGISCSGARNEVAMCRGYGRGAACIAHQLRICQYDYQQNSVNQLKILKAARWKLR